MSSGFTSGHGKTKRKMKMTEYHKINALFMRDMDQPGHPLIPGAWAQPEFEYLADNKWEFTEKVDGTNIRVYLERRGDYTFVEYKGRSDNASIPKPLLTYLEETFPAAMPWEADKGRGYLIGRWMFDNDLTSVTLYGEGYGPKIQSGGNYRKDQSFVLFDVKIDNWWLTRDNVDDIARKLGIDSVPAVGYGTLWDAIEIVTPTNTSYMASEWGNFEAEGIVARPVVPLFTRAGNRVIAKIKARDFR